MKSTMKRSQKWLLVLSVLIVFCLIFPLFVHAQSMAPDPTPCDYADPQAVCPIDGGLVELLAAGVLYGIVKYKTKNKEGNLQIAGKEEN